MELGILANHVEQVPGETVWILAVGARFLGDLSLALRTGPDAVTRDILALVPLHPPGGENESFVRNSSQCGDHVHQNSVYAEFGEVLWFQENLSYALTCQRMHDGSEAFPQGCGQLSRELDMAQRTLEMGPLYAVSIELDGEFEARGFCGGFIIHG